MAATAVPTRRREARAPAHRPDIFSSATARRTAWTTSRRCSPPSNLRARRAAPPTLPSLRSKSTRCSASGAPSSTSPPPRPPSRTRRGTTGTVRDLVSVIRESTAAATGGSRGGRLRHNQARSALITGSWAWAGRPDAQSRSVG